MDFSGVKVGFALTGSFCTIDSIQGQMRSLIEMNAEVIPIVSSSLLTLDTRFGTAKALMEVLERITGKCPIDSIVKAEPIGPQQLLDVLVVAPCTGNTLAKFAHGITDTCVLMAMKSQLRNSRPVIISISTNDGLGNNAANLGKVLTMRNVYFVPFRQDDPIKKPRSLVAEASLIPASLHAALRGEQLQPIIVA
ncbi:MAG: dipicolinate synthase subunit B [Limnochordia bacterium]|jgi:dipicolinate synthase subunit B|nr:dipicolinate synthase subunit B [Limnochordia bacterium]MDD2629868.1 dipicolinate synthase subunit B [Limnochordia bacterium]